METIIFIYGLIDPRTSEIRYIGYTPDLDKRLRYHIKDSKKEHNHKANWIKQLLREGLKPEITILQEVPYNQWAIAEMAWIRLGWEEGWPLTNDTEGGGGILGHKHSDEEKQRRRERMLGEKNPFFGRKHTEETRLIMKEKRKLQKSSRLGQHHTEETKLKMKEYKHMLGKHHSEETKRKISEAQKGNKHGLGRIFSFEAREKISLGNRGKHSKITEDQVREIRRRRNNGESQTNLAKEFGILQSTVSNIVRRKTMDWVD